MVEDIKRQTAYKSTIHTLNNGTFVKKEGWESSYIMTDYGDFARVNIIAVVVNKDASSVILEDGTGQISGRLFDKTEQLDKINVGDLVVVIGKPREYNQKVYITIEIIKTVDKTWVAYRKKELGLIKKIRELENIPKIEAKKIEPEIVENISTTNIKDRIAKAIKELDKGNGASIEDVLRLSKMPNGDEILSDMMMRGEIYEFKAGQIKLM